MIQRSTTAWWGLVIVAMIIVACSPQSTTLPTPKTVDEYPNGSLLVSARWLLENMDHPGLRIIDMRASGAFMQGHIPGAVNVPVGAITSTVDNVPFEFDRQKIVDTLSNAGISQEQTLVIYDDLGMMNAARLFWTLEYVGHTDVRILNGGWNGWVQEELEITDIITEVNATSYTMNLDASKIASTEEVLQSIDDPNVVIVDARSPQEYTGEVKLADRGGHIPGAVNLVWLDTLRGGDTVYTIDPDWQEELRDDDVEVFRSAQEIRTLLDERSIVPDKQIITYCQTLWRGAHVYFLLRLMGFEDVRGYDGSWAEWGNRPDLPVVTGPEPGET